MSHRHLASGTDRIMRGGQYLIRIGPLTVPPAEAVTEALEVIAKAGAFTRIGLEPSSRRLWNWDPSDTPVVRRLQHGPGDPTAESILKQTRGAAEQPRPLEVYLASQHMYFNVEHGLGDYRFVKDFVPALFELCDGRVPKWLSGRESHFALAETTARTFLAHPAEIRRARDTAALLRSRRRQDPKPPPDIVSWHPSLALATSNIGAAAEAEIEKWRRSHSPRPGGAATWLYLARRAFKECGIAMTSSTMVAFDCRRYLRRRQAVNGNFATGIAMPSHDGITLTELTGLFEELKTSALPLMVMALVSAVQLTRGNSSGAAATTRDANALAEVMYTDWGRLRDFDGLPWVSEDREFVCGTDPDSPHAITVLNSSIGPTRVMSISYHDNVYSRETVERAARLIATDAPGLLSRV
jgi:hypothetical protein